MSAMSNFWPKVPAPSATTVDGPLDDIVAMKTPAPKGPKPPPEVPKTYVHISSIGVGESFDDKYKATLPAVMNAKLAAGVNGSAKLTTDEAPTGFYLGGSLTLTRTATGISALLTMQLGDWPKELMWGFAKPNGSIEVSNPAKIDGDVEFLMAAVLVKALATVVPQFEGRVK